MPAAIPVSRGDRFGRLTVIGEAPSSRQERMILCQCDCGNKTTITFKSARTGNTSSCGCLRSDMVSLGNTKHGRAARGVHRVPEYGVWKQMRERCNNPNAKRWKDYGGRGISVCSRWDSFELFLADMGPRPSKLHQIDRWPDNDGNYEPGNTRWATQQQQQRNKRNSRIIKAFEREGNR